MLSFFPSSTGWQCDWKLFWPPESAIRGRTLWVGGRPKGYFDFFEEKTTYVADWLMVKLETSPTRMLCSVHDDLGKTGNWVFQGNLPVSATCMAASTPNFPFVLRDWTFQTKKIELSNENQRWKIQRQPYCFFPPNLTLHSSQLPIMVQSLCVRPNLFWKKTNIKSLIQALILCKKGRWGGSPDKMPISSFGIGEKCR